MPFTKAWCDRTISHWHGRSAPSQYWHSMSERGKPPTVRRPQLRHSFMRRSGGRPAWRPPESPLAVPVEDVGPSPALDVALPGGDAGEHGVPAAMLDGHPGAAIDGLEADFDLGVVELMAGVAIQEHETRARLPHGDTAALEALARGRVVDLDPATAHTRLDAYADRPTAVVPIDRPWLPPVVDFVREDRKRGGGIERDLDGGAGDVGTASTHVIGSLLCGRSA